MNSYTSGGCYWEWQFVKLPALGKVTRETPGVFVDHFCMDLKEVDDKSRKPMSGIVSVGSAALGGPHKDLLRYDRSG